MCSLTRVSYPSPRATRAGALAPCYACLVEFPDLKAVFPFVEQIGFGAVAGFAAGYALKKVGKLLAIAVGLLFVALQLLAYFGFVSIDWANVQRSVDPMLTGPSLNSAWRTVLHVLTFNVAFAVAFVPALVFGLRRG